MPYLEADHFCLSAQRSMKVENGEENKDMKCQDCNGEPCCMRKKAHSAV